MRRGNGRKFGLPRLSRALVVATGLLVIAAIAANRMAQNRVASTYVSQGVLGRSVTSSDAAINVSKVTSAPLNNTDMKRITVSVDLKNISTQLIQVSPGLDMLLTDDRGANYVVTAKYLPPSTSIGGTLYSGKTMSMNVDFEVPASRSPRSFVFHSETTNKQTEIKL